MHINTQQLQFSHIQSNLTTQTEIKNVHDSLFNFVTDFKEKKQTAQRETDIQQAIYHYNLVFSCEESSISLQNRNIQIDNTLMNFFDDEQKYLSRRRKRIQCIVSKEKTQIKMLTLLYDQNKMKYLAILQFLKFFSELKQKNKADYYSHKTFCAIKSASCQEISQMVNILKKIYFNLIKDFKDDSKSLIRQFLIIPRFLISRQKIQEFIRDETIQYSFQFLVSNSCLGHENNQANKKMPGLPLIVRLENLLQKQNGKESFKTICSINHGNKYKLQNGAQAYFELFNKSLQELKSLENKVKRVKKVPKSKNKKQDDQFILQPQFIRRRLKYNKCLKGESNWKQKMRRMNNLNNQNIYNHSNIHEREQKCIEDSQSQLLIKQFQIINSKIINNIILIFPPTNQY